MTDSMAHGLKAEKAKEALPLPYCPDCGSHAGHQVECPRYLGGSGPKRKRKCLASGCTSMVAEEGAFCRPHEAEVPDSCQRCGARAGEKHRAECANIAARCPSSSDFYPCALPVGHDGECRPTKPSDHLAERYAPDGTMQPTSSVLLKAQAAELDDRCESVCGLRGGVRCAIRKGKHSNEGVYRTPAELVHSNEDASLMWRDDPAIPFVPVANSESKASSQVAAKVLDMVDALRAELDRPGIPEPIRARLWALHQEAAGVGRVIEELAEGTVKG